MQPPLDDATIAAVKAAMKEHKGVQTHAAKALGISRQTLQGRLDAIAKYEAAGKGPNSFTKAQLLEQAAELAKPANGDMTYHQYRLMTESGDQWRRHWRTWAAFRAAFLEVAGLQDDPIEAVRGEDERKRLRAELLEARRQQAREADYTRGVFKLAQQSIVPPDWTATLGKGKGLPGLPLLFFSDAQWGEVIRADELDGINEFNAKIAAARYKRLIEKTLELSFTHEPNPRYPGIVYVRGGDMVSGDIHDELRKTNDLASIPSVVDLVAHETAGIRELLKHFKKVHVVSVPGNHGRQSMKPEAKGFVYNNYDTLSALMLEREFKGDKRVTWLTPVSGDALLTLYGWEFCVTHGDRNGSRGGQGFIGPVATITRGMQKVLQYYAAMGRRIDVQLIGHYHVAMDIQWGYANGSLPGYSEYAKMIRAKPGEPPTQWLLYVHPHHAVAKQWKIFLEKSRVVPANVHLPWVKEAA